MLINQQNILIKIFCEGPRLQSPRIFISGDEVSNSTINLDPTKQLLSLLCKSEHNITWSINQRKIGFNPKLTVRRPGLYLCKAKINDTEMSYVSYADIRGSFWKGKRPTMPEIEGAKVIPLGGHLRLNCSSPETNLTFSWFRTTSNESIAAGQILEISNLTESGIYYCQAENSAGMRQSALKEIEICLPPDVAILPEIKELELSDVSPQPAVFCLSNQKKAKTFWKIANETTSNGTFEIDPDIFRRLPDGSRISCIAENEFGNQSSQDITFKKKYFSTTTIPLSSTTHETTSTVITSTTTTMETTVKTTKIEPFLKGIKLSVLTEKNSSTGLYATGSLVQLICSAEGSPDPKITWIKYQKDSIVNLTENILVTNNSILIPEATEADSGIYVCQAENTAGRSSKKQVLRFVSKPDLDVQNEEINFILGRNVTLKCDTQSDSDSVNWEIPDNLQYQISKNKTMITIFEVFADVSVVCQVTNGLFEAAKTFQLRTTSQITLKSENDTTVLSAGDRLVLNCDIQEIVSIS